MRHIHFTLKSGRGLVDVFKMIWTVLEHCLHVRHIHFALKSGRELVDVFMMI